MTKKLKRTLLVTSLVIIISFIILEVVGHFLLKANKIDLNENETFLLETTWDQVGDYAQFVEEDYDVGCWATAIAQITHYHRLNPIGKIRYITSLGDSISVNLYDTRFEHDIFVSKLEENTPEETKNQIAKYLRYIAALIYTDFGSSGYLEHETMMSRIENHLGCSAEIYQYNKESYLENRNKIKNLIISEIDLKRPIMFYFDDGNDFGHAVVIDGYLNKNELFLVHINQGMGGRNDGWYNPFDKIFGIRDDLQTRFLVTLKPD